MWAIKILNGSQSGKIFPLQQGNNVLGRSVKADIKLADQGVSKSHAQIFVTNDKVIISDLKSSNGTFVNGIKVQNHGLRTGDKVLINQTIFTIFQLPDNVVFAGSKPSLPGRESTAIRNQLMVQGNTALQTSPMAQANLPSPYQTPATPVPLGVAPPPPAVITSHNSIEAFVRKADNYIDEVALPPVYRTAEKVDFKYMLLVFSLIFIFMTTFLSLFPLSRLTKESVLNESKRRSLTMARNLALMNKKALDENSELSLTTDFIARESGVEKAMIVNAQSGGILAPPSLSGRFINDPFLVSLKNTQVEMVERINDNQVGASVPMRVFNPDATEPVIVAYAVVVYNIDRMAVDFNHTLNLFVQIFLIACTLGAVVFFVQYRLMIHPMKSLNREIDRALREGKSDVQVPFQLQVFQDLIANMNSALSRISQDFTGTDQFASQGDKSAEANDVVRMFDPIPAMALAPDNHVIVSANSAMEAHPLFDGGKVSMSMTEILDKGLSETLAELLGLCESNPNSRHASVLSTQGVEKYELTAKAVLDGTKASYILITMHLLAEE